MSSSNVMPVSSVISQGVRVLTKAMRRGSTAEYKLKVLREAKVGFRGNHV